MNESGQLVERVAAGDPAKALLAMLILAAVWGVCELIAHRYR